MDNIQSKKKDTFAQAKSCSLDVLDIIEVTKSNFFKIVGLEQNL